MINLFSYEHFCTLVCTMYSPSSLYILYISKPLFWGKRFQRRLELSRFYPKKNNFVLGSNIHTSKEEQTPIVLDQSRVFDAKTIEWIDNASYCKCDLNLPAIKISGFWNAFSISILCVCSLIRPYCLGDFWVPFPLPTLQGPV